jgi:formylglycine-generating enzyme required for sulfatase activity
MPIVTSPGTRGRCNLLILATFFAGVASACGSGTPTAAGDGAPPVPDVPADPGPSDRGATDPWVAEPGPSDPGIADPGPADPGATDPGSAPCAAVDWVAIPGGTFPMGAADLDGTSQPVHAVTVPGFEIGRTEATVCEFAACVAAGSCAAAQCGQSGDAHPVVCVDWNQSGAFCDWAGGRLCSEAEWEYAARNGSAGNLYPWGDGAPTCDDAVFTDPGVGCSASGTAPACSKPSGTDAWGLCDLAGNAWEWVGDDWHGSYAGAPADGSAWVDAPRGSARVFRGGSFFYGAADLRASCRYRYPYDPTGYDFDLGTRCCRSGATTEPVPDRAEIVPENPEQLPDVSDVEPDGPPDAGPDGAAEPEKPGARS